MSATRVAFRYSKALLELSQEKHFLEEAYRDMQQIRKVCREHRDFRAMLRNPLIHPEKKTIILKALFEKSFHAMTMNFLEMVVRKRRELFLDEMAHHFIEQYKELKGITSAIVITAAGIDDSLRSQIIDVVKKVARTEVALEESINPEIIGGFILRFGDIQYDSSVLRNLNQFRLHFSRNLYKSKLWNK